MLRRLAGLLGFFFFWMIGALVFPIFFWVVSGIILTLTIIHVVRAKEFSGGAPFFTGIAVITALLATGGFFVGGSGVNDAEATLSADAADDADDADDADADAEEDAETVGTANGKLAKTVPAGDDSGAPDGSMALDVKAAIKDATALGKNKKSCKSLEAIAAAWQDLARIPGDNPDHPKALRAAKILEVCRKQTATALQKNATAARVKARVALLKTLKAELAAKGIKGNPLAQGKVKEKLMIRLAKTSEEKINELTGGGAVEAGTLLGRFQAAGFTKVTVISGKVLQSFDLTPTADTAGAMAQLEALGLAQPLQMP